MTQLNLCVPVLRRYDLLRELLLSLRGSTRLPDAVYVLNNGLSFDKVTDAVLDSIDDVEMRVWTPPKAMGVAESWNWFLANAKADWLIANDDVTFGPESLERMAETDGDCVSALLGTNACSCFLLRESCVRKVGTFDETISPGYAYFEDCDFLERMLDAGTDFTGVECGVTHGGSKTIETFSDAEMREHHRKFYIAQENFVKKWGRMPHGRARQKLPAGVAL